MDLNRKFYSVKETAKLLSVCEKTIRRLIKRGIFAPSKAIRKLLIPAEQIESFYKRTA